MSKTETLTVELPEELVAQVRGAVERGEFRSSDEVVAEALARWNANGEGDVEWMREALREADEAGGPSLPMEEVMDRLQAKYQAIADGASGEKRCA